MSDFIESIFQSVDILIDKKLENLAYDSTVICTVMGGSNGEYRVTDGSSSYFAYSEVEYEEGDTVRVNIPNSDFSQKKFIIGKYTSKEEKTAITYIAPSDSVVNITGNIYTEDQNNNLIDISKSPSKNLIFSKRFSEKELKDFSENGIYDSLVLKADFQTNLGENCLEGTYGLLINLLVQPKSNEIAMAKYTIDFSNNHMFGNPYNFTILSPQERAFNIKSIGLIEGIELYLYQNGDFKYKVNQEGSETLSPLETGSISVKDIDISFGKYLVNIENRTVQIYTDDNLFYKNDENNNETNQKKIGLIWYNKDDNGKYIGFSDGNYKLGLVDEIDYLNKSVINEKLLQTKLEVGPEPTKEDNNDSTIKSKNYLILQTLFNDLNTIWGSVVGIDNDNDSNFISQLKNEYSIFLDKIKDTDFKDKLTTLFNNLFNLSNKQAKTSENEEASSYLQQIINKYIAFKNGYLLIINKQTSEITEEDFWNQFDELKISIENFETQAKSKIKIISSEIKEYLEKYNDFLEKIKKILNKIKESLSIIFKEIEEKFDKDENNVSFISDYLTTTPTVDYTGLESAEYDNTYCIYWYRYEKDYIDESEFKLMPDGWRLLSQEELSLDTTNLYQGLPSPKSEYPNNKYPNFETSSIYRYMQHNLETEKYVAIVFYNHNYYKSNELVFTNKDDVIEDLILSSSDVLKFEHKEHSIDSYQIYNESYQLNNYFDESYEREIQCHYRGGLVNDRALINAKIYWYIPIGSTMISYDEEFLLNHGFDNDIGNNDKYYSRTGYVCFHKQIDGIETTNEDGETSLDFNNTNGYDNRSFWYKIKPYLDPSATLNHIICKVVLNDTKYKVEATQLFSFGVQGNNGTKYTFFITNKTSQTAVTNNKDLELSLFLKDADNKTIKIENIDDIQIEWKTCSLDVSESDGSYDKYIAKGQQVNEDGSIDITILATEGLFGIITAIKEVEIVNDGTNEISDDKKITLECQYSIPYSIDPNYRLSGTTQVVYNNLGTIDNKNMYNGSYQLFDENYEEKQNIEWKIEGYPENDNYAPKLSNKNTLIPLINYITGNENIYCITAYETKEGSEDTLLYKCPIIIKQYAYPSTLLNEWGGGFEINEENGTILSSLLCAGRKNSDNTFDGILMGEIDLNAGIDLDTPGNENLGLGKMSGLGLYGFHNGTQAFGFNINGTGFIGKSGSGRIVLNGNNGFIASGNWFENGVYKNGQIVSPGTAGMCIDLVNGHIDAYDFRLSGDGVRLNSNPVYSSTDPDQGDYFYVGNGTSYIRYYKKNDNETALDIRADSIYIGDTPAGGDSPSINLDQDTIFETLFKNPQAGTTGEEPTESDYSQGFALVDGKVYISGEMIKVGKIESKNYSEGGYEEKDEKISVTSEIESYISKLDECKWLNFNKTDNSLSITTSDSKIINKFCLQADSGQVGKLKGNLSSYTPYSVQCMIDKSTFENWLIKGVRYNVRTYSLVKGATLLFYKQVENDEDLDIKIDNIGYRFEGCEETISDNTLFKYLKSSMSFLSSNIFSLISKSDIIIFQSMDDSESSVTINLESKTIIKTTEIQNSGRKIKVYKKPTGMQIDLDNAIITTPFLIAGQETDNKLGGWTISDKSINYSSYSEPNGINQLIHYNKRIVSGESADYAWKIDNGEPTVDKDKTCSWILLYKENGDFTNDTVFYYKGAGSSTYPSFIEQKMDETYSTTNIISSTDYKRVTIEPNVGVLLIQNLSGDLDIYMQEERTFLTEIGSDPTSEIFMMIGGRKETTALPSQSNFCIKQDGTIYLGYGGLGYFSIEKGSFSYCDLDEQQIFSLKTVFYSGKKSQEFILFNRRDNFSFNIFNEEVLSIMNPSNNNKKVAISTPGAFYSERDSYASFRHERNGYGESIFGTGARGKSGAVSIAHQADSYIDARLDLYESTIEDTIPAIRLMITGFYLDSKNNQQENKHELVFGSNGTLYHQFTDTSGTKKGNLISKIT